MFDTHLHFTPGRVQTGRKKEVHKIGLFEILIYQIHLQRSFKNKVEPFKMCLDLYFSSVGNSRQRVEPCNITFWDVCEDNGICKLEIWQGKTEYLNCLQTTHLEIICTKTDKMGHFSLPIFQVLQQNGNLEKTLPYSSFYRYSKWLRLKGPVSSFSLTVQMVSLSSTVSISSIVYRWKNISPSWPAVSLPWALLQIMPVSAGAC